MTKQEIVDNNVAVTLPVEVVCDDMVSIAFLSDLADIHRRLRRGGVKLQVKLVRRLPSRRLPVKG